MAQEKTMHQKITERYKTDKATLYSTIGFIRTNHALRLTNKFGEVQTFQYSTSGTDTKALEEGLKLARQQSGPSCCIEYSSDSNQTLQEANTKRIDKTLNESYTASQSASTRFKTLLG